jgi:hypothetical protein
MLKLSWMKHLERLKGLKIVKRYGVPAASAETHAKGQRRSWQLISTTLVL